jgi:hypothetical protein
MSRHYALSFEDLDIERQSEIEEDLANDALEDLKEECEERREEIEKKLATILPDSQWIDGKLKWEWIAEHLYGLNDFEEEGVALAKYSKDQLDTAPHPIEAIKEPLIEMYFKHIGWGIDEFCQNQMEDRKKAVRLTLEI